ncbi:MAG: GAF domain-containing SpoIIE family protein phosphatase [bacterium]
MPASSQGAPDGALDTDPQESDLANELEDLRVRVGNLSRLIDVTVLVSSSLNLKEVMNSVMELAKEMMEAEAASIMLWNDELECLEFELSVGGVGMEQLKSIRIVKGQGIAGTVAETGEPLLVADVSKDPRFYAKADETTGFVTKSILAAPLIVHDGIVGVSEVLNHKEGRPFTKHDLELFATFCRQVAVAVENARLHEKEVKQSLLDQQMKMAAEIQMSFLPAELPGDEDSRFEIGAFTRSAQDVGGDMYACEVLPDGRIALALGDVSGKGVPAALYMARVVSEFRMRCSTGAPPCEVLTVLNKALAGGTMRGMFVTFVYGILDPETGALELANAGQLPPVLASRGGKARWMGAASGPPLGMVPTSQYASEKVRLEPSDTLLFYSDGIVEAQDVSGEQFDPHLLPAAAKAGTGAKRLLAHVLGSVEEFSKGASQADDMTMVSMSWTG